MLSASIKEQFATLHELSELFATGDWEEIDRKTRILINKANEDRADGTYGMIMHIATTYLGLSALEKGEIELAKSHLIDSLLVPTNPYIRSAGPTMLLAKKLYLLGETDTVVKYITLCELNWTFPLRYYYTWKWKRAIRKGKTPNFGMYTYIYLKHFSKLPDEVDGER